MGSLQFTVWYTLRDDHEYSTLPQATLSEAQELANSIEDDLAGHQIVIMDQHGEEYARE